MLYKYKLLPFEILTQYLISNNKIVWGNEAAFASQPESLWAVWGSEHLKYLSQSVPVLRLTLIDFSPCSSLTAGSEGEPVLAFEEIFISFVSQTSVCFLSWAGRKVLFLLHCWQLSSCSWEQVGVPAQASPKGDGVSLHAQDAETGQTLSQCSGAAST